MQSHLLFIQVLAVVAICARQQNDQPFSDRAYRDIPWDEDSEHGFFGREPAAFHGHNAVPPSLTTDSLVPTRTHPRGLIRRNDGCSLETNNCFTFLCPTSIQVCLSLQGCHAMAWMLSDSALMVVVANLETTVESEMESLGAAHCMYPFLPVPRE
ncbi:hypothetical protein NCS56_01392000 [Fusarium sp. Ph1]|nr:hypothetical protein NCS56_01392000 [Fusarium sp. Ph1]